MTAASFELIKINRDQMVDARELHAFLGVETQFSKWITRRIEEYGFTQPVDFILVRNDYNEIEYLHVSLDMAKELCMVEKNERGKQARKYFIEVEKRWRKPVSNLIALQQTINEMVRIEQETNTRLNAVEGKLLLMASDSDYRTVRGLARVMGISISEKAAADLGKRATQICKGMALHIGKVSDERHGSVNSYPIKVLEPLLAAFKDGKIS